MKPVPLLDIRAQHASLGSSLQDALASVVASGNFIGGPEVESFERAFAAYCGSDWAVGVGNGTDALAIALRSAGVGPGDEVVTSALTFIATVEAIIAVGATPILVDPELDTGLISATATAAAITPRTAALIPVHLYGQPVDLCAFRALADKHDLVLVEDAAQAHGARWDEKRVGSVGDLAAFSFYPGKNLGALGDGGAITTSQRELAVAIRRCSDHGRDEKFTHLVLGQNSRLDTIQAAVLELKLSKLDEWNQSRRSHAAVYDAAFRDRPEITPLTTDPRATHVYHQYVVRVRERDSVFEYLRDQGITAGMHYPIPLHRQPAISGYFETNALQNAEVLAAEVLSLPVFPELARGDQERVIEALVQATVGDLPRPAGQRRLSPVDN